MKRLFKGAMPVCVAILLLSALFLSVAGARASSPPWKIFQNHLTLNAPTPLFRSLAGVAAVSANDVWAVGSFSRSNSSTLTLIEHWNGSAWSIVPSPDPGAISNGLAGIVAISASDIWAVGSFSNINGLSRSLTEHWNGNTWSVVASPNAPDMLNNGLNGIAAISARDIWAVGSSSNSSASQTLIEHWNGSSWSITGSPDTGSQNGLSAVATVKANDIWAVGSSSNSSSASQALTEHWNGSTWSVVASPSPGSSFVTLDDITAVSANNIWAAGSTNGFTTTLIEHWNGAQWSVVPSPDPEQINILIGIAAVSSHNIWAVGQALNFNGQTLIEHWNGSSWSAINSPNQPGSVNNFLTGVAVISASNIWAVGGYQGSNFAEQTLIEHWNGNSWSIVPGP